MPTEKLYYQDQYLRTFRAAVLTCQKEGEDWAVTLSRTAFYPGGGGQAGDTGTLGGAAVHDTRERDGEILHLCSAPLTPGTEVSGEIDFARRFDLMQQHSGEHIVSGLAHARFGCRNVGFHMGESVTVIDFDVVLSREDLLAIERAANEIVWADVPVTASWPSSEELERIPYRSKKELSGSVRLVTIPGADVCACCGTHVSRSGEIGPIKLLSVQHLRQGVRVELLCGARAWAWLSRVSEENRTNSALLSAPPLETSAAARRLLEERDELRYRLFGVQERLFAARAEALPPEGDALLLEEGLSPEELRRLCDKAMQRIPGVVAVFSGDDENGYAYAVGQAGGDVRELVKTMNAALNGRGGGKPPMAQGFVRCKREAIERFWRGRTGRP